MSSEPKNYRIEPIPTSRRFAQDAGYLGRRTHIVHGLLELDVTIPRQLIQAHEAQTGERLSFTAYIVHCLAAAVAQNPHLHAYRDWRNRLIIFDEVDITVMVEIEIKGRKVPMPHNFKNVAGRSYLEIHEELRGVQANPLQTSEVKASRRLLLLPAFLRHLFYRLVLRLPVPFREFGSPILVTAVGMFVPGGGWAITMPSQTLTVALGSIVEKPGVVQGQILIREYLNITMSVNHDIVDGAPAARFARLFKELVVSGSGLPNYVP